MEGANPAPRPHKVKSASPTISTGLRPKRSASGPTMSGAVENPARKIAIVAAVVVWLAPRSAWMRARLGSAMSIASGGNAAMAARKTTNARPWTLNDIKATPENIVV